MIPACSHTGTPRHFHSSTTSGQASLMRARTRASVSPRQSPSSLILPSISREGEALSFAFVAALLVFFMAWSLSSWLLARQPAPRRLTLVVVGRLEHGLGKSGLDAQHGLAAVGEAVLAAGRHDDELARGERDARLSDPNIGLPF